MPAPARRRIPRSTVALIRVVTLLAVAVPTAAAAQVPSMQAVMLGGYWSRVDSTHVLQTAAGTQISIQTGYIAPQLMDLIDASVIGKSPAATMQVATYPSVGSSTLLKVDGARIQAVDLPPADASRTDRTFIGVKFALAGVPVSGPAPASFPPPNPLGVWLRSDHFSIQFDSLIAPTVTFIPKMTVVLPDALRGNIPQLVLTYTTTSTAAKTFMSGLQQWLTSRTTRNGTLTFFTNDFKSTLLIVRYRGLRVLSNNISGSTATATFAMTGISVDNVVMR